jgi:Lrp/AsnC family transcriptional regulator for asnA, asnC and gidA
MLDELDKKILYHLDLNSSTPFLTLGKTLKVPNETVAFRVKRLVQTGYIKHFITTINVSKLNTFYYKFFYKFHKRTTTIDDEVVGYLKQNPSIAYLASLEGRYDLTFLVVARGITDLYEFLVPFKAKFGENILEQEILTMTGVHRFNMRFFMEEAQTLQHSQYPEQLSSPHLKDLDYQLITFLARNSRMTNTELASELKVEPNVISYHVAKLKKTGILGSPVLELDFGKFDVAQYQVNFSLKDHTNVAKIIETAAQERQSTFATVTLGKYDLALEFAVQSVKELRDLVNKINSGFPDVINSHEVFSMQEHSINWFPKAV